MPRPLILKFEIGRRCTRPQARPQRLPAASACDRYTGKRCFLYCVLTTLYILSCPAVVAFSFKLDGPTRKTVVHVLFVAS